MKTETKVTAAVAAGVFALMGIAAGAGALVNERYAGPESSECPVLVAENGDQTTFATALHGPPESPQDGEARGCKLITGHDVTGWGTDQYRGDSGTTSAWAPSGYEVKGDLCLRRSTWHSAGLYVMEQVPCP